MARQKFLFFCLPAFFVCLLTSSFTATAMSSLPDESASAPVDESSKPRLIVLTDMTSIESGVREPDDAQSMIRLMMYANDFDIEGLVASSGLQHGHVVRPEIIHKIVNAYGKCQPNLALHNKSYPDFYNKSYPSADSLRRVIKSGQPDADRDIPVFQSIGRGKDTEASRWIIQMADKSDARPLWIAIWGGSADLAQALWTVRENRSPAEVAEFIAKLRVEAAGDQDSTGPWIKSQFPNLFYATRTEGARGMYRGGDASLVSSEFVQTHIKGAGALGDIYPDYRGGDRYSGRLGRVEGIKGGDSGTFMGLIRNGLNDQDHLTWVNWGGPLKRDARNRNRYTDAVDPVGNYRKDLSRYFAGIYRWRPTFQPEYQARLDWCEKPYSQANHVPINNRGIATVYTLAGSGQNVRLEGDDWSDPDGNNLNYRWEVLKEQGASSKKVNITNAYSRFAQFKAPRVKNSETVHILLTVTDDGQPALSSYRRFNFIVLP